MSWRRVQLIFQREIRDQLRDRRTLFMIAVLPLLLYPAMGVGVFQMMALSREQPTTVVVLGASDLPEQPQLIKESENSTEGPLRFVQSWFRVGDDADKLDVYTDSISPRAGDAEGTPKQKQLLADAKRIRQLYELREMEEASPIRVGEGQDQLKKELGTLFAKSQIQVLIIVPDGFGKNIGEVNQRLLERPRDGEEIPDYGRPIIIHNKADKKSQIAYQRVSDAVSAWESAILRDRLKMAELPETLDRPVNAEAFDLAQVEDISQNLWSILFPALLIIMSVTGAFYPAIDLAAGEKERGTMETLLICPASRPEIVLGKFFTVMTFSMSTAVLNMLSMGFTGNYIVSLTSGGALNGIGSLTPPSLSALLWVLILLIPLSALFSALCLSLATFAKSSKEGQYYLTPLLMVTLGLTVFCVMPTTEITQFLSVLPVVGPALLLKELLSSHGTAGTLIYVIPVLASSAIYSLLALWWAIEQFSREEVLFREAEQFEPGLWLRHLLRDKEATPNFAEAVVCFVLIMLLQFGSIKFLQGAFDPAAPIQALRMQMIFLVVTVGCPALFMAVMLTTNVRQTLRLRLPSAKMLGLALILPLALHPISSELLANLKWFFPEIPPAAKKMLGLLESADLPLWIILLVFAVTPAVCEELAFRGFILTGFSRSNRKWLPIFMSSLAFGVVHMIPQQVFNATLLGIVLGLIVYHSRSLFPAILFHLVFNSIPALLSRVDDSAVTDGPATWFVTIESGELRFTWLALAIAGVVAILLLQWLVRQPVEGAVASPSGTIDSDGAVHADVGVTSSVHV